jgi:hypothetical protein
MPTREIPRNEWVAFFDSFSRQHEGWLATVEVLAKDLGAQVEASEQPLAGITADIGQDTQHDVVSILIGGTSGEHVAHMIRNPEHVRVKQTPGGADEALDFEAHDGVTTLLRFRSAMPTESLDGFVVK